MMRPMLMLGAFGAVDWVVLLLYFVALLAIGWSVSRKTDEEEDFFLGGRRIPAWAAAVSLLGTALSAATFIGVPQFAFDRNLTYLILNIGSILGAVIVAWWFIPAIYHAGTLTVYGYLDQRIAPGAAMPAAVAFLVGRLLASGARLFMAGIAFSLVLFGYADNWTIAITIVVLSVVGTTYTAMGGIRAVVWTDTLQVILVVGAALLSVILLLRAVNMPIAQILEQLRHFPTETETVNKLRVVDLSFDWRNSYTLWSGIAITAFNVAAYGCDHDLAQRLLTTRSARRGSASLIGGILIGLPVTGLFLAVGLLLAVYHLQHPELLSPLDSSETVYPRFLLTHLPVGLCGLAMAGLLAVSMSSIDSVVNAMAATWLADVRPSDKPHAPRRTSIVMGAMLMLFGLLMLLLYRAIGDRGLIDFALSIMTFAYTGLLGVFLTALLLPGRGHRLSVIAALVCGALFVVFAQMLNLAIPWTMLGGTALSFCVCAVGKFRYYQDRSHSI